MKLKLLNLVFWAILAGCSMEKCCDVFPEINSERHHDCEVLVDKITPNTVRSIVSVKREGGYFIYAGKLASSMDIFKLMKTMAAEGDVREYGLWFAKTELLIA